jgi:hypothetical protein
MLSLVLCGGSCRTMGQLLWKEHPTIRALIKMTTSLRYRFPTVDADDETRDLMKQQEQASRDEVSLVLHTFWHCTVYLCVLQHAFLSVYS